jgi:hypothetical protein
MLRIMTLEATELSHKKLTTVGDAPVHGSAPAIPAEHSARLIALGYMVHLEGRLRTITPGKVRLDSSPIEAAGEVRDWNPA